MIDSYRKLSLAKYDEIKEIMEKDTEDIDKQVELIASLANMTMDDVYNLPISKYEELVNGIEFLYELPKPKSGIPSKITIGDKKYKVLKNVDKMTTGQYIDLQSYIKNNMGVAYILTTIIIPEGHKYNEGYSVEELQKDIYNYLNIEDAMSIAFFLRRKLQYTINGILIFLDWKLKKVEKGMKEEQKTQIEEARKRIKDLVLSGTGFTW